MDVRLILIYFKELNQKVHSPLTLALSPLPTGRQARGGEIISNNTKIGKRRYKEQ
jgi:hypothetical protein